MHYLIVSNCICCNIQSEMTLQRESGRIMSKGQGQILIAKVVNESGQYWSGLHACLVEDTYGI